MRNDVNDAGTVTHQWRLALQVVIPATAATLSAAEFHISPDGADSNPGTQARPFATVARAQQAVSLNVNKAQ